VLLFHTTAELIDSIRYCGSTADWRRLVR